MSDIKSNTKKRERENEVDLSESKKSKSNQDEIPATEYDYSQYYNQYYQYPGYNYNAYDWSQYYSYYQQPTQYGNMNQYYPAQQQQQQQQYQVNDNLKRFESFPKRTIYRKAADKAWDDPTLADWPENDFRLFVGNLGNDVTDEVLKNAFSKYKSVAKVRVIRDKQEKSKGFGFVSLLDPKDFVAALKEMNGKYVGSRPCKVTKSDWKSRNDSDKMKIKKKK